MHQDEIQRVEQDDVLLDAARLAQEWQRQRQEIEDLRTALASRPVIDQAKGILMAMYAIDSVQAFRVLARWSQTRNVKVRDLAAALVEDVVCARSRPGALFGVSNGERLAARPRPPHARAQRPNQDPRGR